METPPKKMHTYMDNPTDGSKILVSTALLFPEKEYPYETMVFYVPKDGSDLKLSGYCQRGSNPWVLHLFAMMEFSDRGYRVLKVEPITPSTKTSKHIYDENGKLLAIINGELKIPKWVTK